MFAETDRSCLVVLCINSLLIDSVSNKILYHNQHNNKMTYCEKGFHPYYLLVDVKIY